MMPVRSAEGKVIGHSGEGNRKDVRNAVEAAHKAAPGYVLTLPACNGSLYHKY